MVIHEFVHLRETTEVEVDSDALGEPCLLFGDDGGGTYLHIFIPSREYLEKLHHTIGAYLQDSDQKAENPV